jgi:DNA polymerase
MNRSALGATPNRLAVDGTSTSGDVASTSNSPPTTPQDKALALDELRARCVKCLGCLLNKTRTNLVFGEGNPAAELVFVGEAPGEDEDRTGRPFVGRAGQKLTEMIQAMGLRREDVYICNLLKCRPPNNRPPAPEEVQACWPYLVRQLQIIRPKVIVTLGNPATQNLLGTTIGITKIRGNWQKLPDLAPGLGGTAVMPTFHPSYLIRSYTIENRHAVWSDIQKVMERLGLKRK